MFELKQVEKEDYTEDEAKLICDIADALEMGTLFEKDEELSHGLFGDVMGTTWWWYAACRFADQCLMGIGCDVDTKRALGIFETYADQGNPRALCSLGRIYCEGLFGVECDAQKGSSYFKRGMEADSATCAFLYAKCLAGGYGTEQDDVEALKIFHNLVGNEEIDPDMYFYIGLFSQEGRGGAEQNYEEARKWYRHGALRDSARCYSQLAYLYSEGLGVDCDDNAVFDYSLRAAELGEVAGCYNLGLCYETGHGVKADLQKAIKFYTIAAENDREEAKEALSRLEESNRADEIVAAGVADFRTGMERSSKELFNAE